MFPRVFHARRLTCRVVFLAVCLLPTMALVVFGAWRAAPVHHQAIRSELAAALALKVSLTGVEHPRPGIIRIEGLELADPESGQPLLQIDVLEARELPSGYRLSAPTATLHTSADGRLYEELHRRLAGGDETLAWRLDVNELHLQDIKQSRMTVGLTAKTEMGPSGPVVDARFRVLGDTSKNPSEIKLFRNREINPATTTFVLQTGDKPLPCALLGQFASAWNAVGPEATFAGRFWTINTSEGRRGELSGQLNRVDLEQLITRNFGHTITGKARLKIDRAVMHQGRLQVAEAHIDGGPGSVSQRLLQAAYEELQMPLLPSGPGRPSEMVEYRRLAASVAIDWQGLRIREYQAQDNQAPLNADRQPGQHAGVVMAGQHNTILVEPQNILPPAAILRALAKEDDDATLVQGPVSNLAKWLPQTVSLPLNPRR